MSNAPSFWIQTTYGRFPVTTGSDATAKMIVTEAKAKYPGVLNLPVNSYTPYIQGKLIDWNSQPTTGTTIVLE